MLPVVPLPVVTHAPVPPVTITPPPLAVVAGVVGWFSVGSSATTFCWFSGPVPRPPTLMLNVRFFHMTLLYSCGYELLRQLPLIPVPAPGAVVSKCPGGHTTGVLEGRFPRPVVSCAL